MSEPEPELSWDDFIQSHVELESQVGKRPAEELTLEVEEEDDSENVMEISGRHVRAIPVIDGFMNAVDSNTHVVFGWSLPKSMAQVLVQEWTKYATADDDHPRAICEFTYRQVMESLTYGLTGFSVDLERSACERRIKP